MRLRSALSAVIAGAAMLALAACGTLGNPDQGSAGITHATLKICQVKDTGALYPCQAEIVDGKDHANAHLKIDAPGGWKVDYGADTSGATQAIAVRAAVDKAVSSDLKQASPGIVESITKAVMSAVGVPLGP